MTASGILRVPLGLAAGASLVAGFSGGLVRLDIVLALETAADHHGVLMVCGFFGTLISLERAVAAGGKTAIAVPALAAAGSALLLSGAPTLAAAA